MPPHPPLRILVACARPLILKVEEWEAELKDAATRHIAAAATALQGVADIGRFWANGRTMGFELYPPRPPEKVIQDKLAGAIPLDSLNVTPKAIPMDVHRLDEEIEAIQTGLQGLKGVEVYVHPAATPAEVLAFLQTNDVDVLQFVGHGDEIGGLYFEDGRGSARRVTPDELALLVQGRIKLLFTGACYSARALAALFQPAPGDSHAIPAAIAVDGQHPIPTRAVQLFATAFYAGLARGRRVQTSFDHGVEAVRQDDLIGERPLPDGADKGMPTPWKRFHLYGDASLAWKPNKDSASAITRLVKATPHRKLPRTDELFVGRNVEVAATVEKLEPPRPGIAEHKPRIVTLHREGGIGKTRLAGAVAEWLAERGHFPGGIVEVDCERAGSSVELAIAVLAALGADQPERLPDPSRAPVEWLRDRDQPLLLLLDNLDNLFPADGSVLGSPKLGCLSPQL